MPLPERYLKEIPEMARIWSPEGYFETQTKIWQAQAEAKNEKNGEPNAEQLAQIKSALVLSPEDYDYLTIAQGHETNRLLRLIQSRVGDGGRVIHLYNTSSDVLDTSLAIQMGMSLDLLRSDFGKLSQSLRGLALQHIATEKIGRSHGQHAIVDTFGHQAARYFAEVERGIGRFDRAKDLYPMGNCPGKLELMLQQIVIRSWKRWLWQNLD
jgi:adenylosuccinate lyase